MAKNLGKKDRIARLVAALPLTLCAFLAPFPLALRLAAFALPALYLAATAVAGSCLGYALMGKNTCPVAATRLRGA